jgi:hypothetical protein
MATAETLQIVASLVSTIDKSILRKSSHSRPAAPRSEDVTEHRDLRLTQEFLLGSILLQASVISADSLSRALQLHTSSGLPLGQCLVQLGAATPEQIASAVAYQDRLREEERHTQSTEPQAHLELRLSTKQKGFVQCLNNQVLGEVLIRLGSITREQLERALQVQRAANVHIGAALVEIGKALEVQKQLRRRVA